MVLPRLFSSDTVYIRTVLYTQKSVVQRFLPELGSDQPGSSEPGSVPFRLC